MGVSNLHTLHGIKIDTDLIGGVQNQALPTGIEVRGEASSGEPWVRFHSMVSQEPRATFMVWAIKSLLDAITTLGTKVNTTTMPAGVSLYAHQMEQGASRTAGATHRKFKYTDGIIVPRILTCTHRGDAEQTGEMVAISDGENAPFAFTDNQNLPAGITDAERFTIGPVTLAGQTFDGIKSLELDYGIETPVESADSDVWPTHAGRRVVKPALTLSGCHIDWLSAAKIPLEGKAIVQSTCAVYLRKRIKGGKFVANNVAQHIKFQVAGMAYIDPAYDAQSNEPGEVTLVLPIEFDGTNDPIVVDTAIAIT